MSRLLSLALLPAAALLYYIYRMDTVEKEPWRLLCSLLAFGCLCALPAAGLEWLGLRLLAGIKDPKLYTLLEAFAVVALAEEGCKFAFLSTTWKHKAFNYRFDAIVYAVCVSLGFAALENVLYVLRYGFATGLLRAVTSVPGHCFFGVFMGYWFGKAKYARFYGLPFYRGMLLLSALIPIGLHGLYDYLCFQSDSFLFVLLFYLFLAAFFCGAIHCVKNASQHDTCVQQSAVPY